MQLQLRSHLPRVQPLSSFPTNTSTFSSVCAPSTDTFTASPSFTAFTVNTLFPWISGTLSRLRLLTDIRKQLRGQRSHNPVWCRSFLLLRCCFLLHTAAWRSSHRFPGTICRPLLSRRSEALSRCLPADSTCATLSSRKTGATRRASPSMYC